MDVFYAYTWGTAGWQAIQAVPLLASPTMIMALLSPEVREPTPLEVYFSRSVGICILTIGVLVVMLSGSVPLSSRLADEVTGEAGATTDAADPKAPYALPTLTVSTFYHVACAFYSYSLYLQQGVSAFLMQTAVSGVFSAIGLWCILFASSDGRISRKTGMDKRTSGFPFKNSEAHKRKGKKGL